MQYSDMTFGEYREKVQRTTNTDLSEHDEMLNYAMGVAGETGEVVEAMKKLAFHGHGMEKVIEEVGDAMWYTTALANKLGIELLQDNISFGFYQAEGRNTRMTFNGATVQQDAIKYALRAYRYAGQVTKNFEMYKGEYVEVVAVFVKPALLDLMSNLAALLETLGISGNDVLRGNVDKLLRRYPNGFSEQASRERVE